MWIKVVKKLLPIMMSSITVRVFHFCMPTYICSIFDPNKVDVKALQSSK